MLEDSHSILHINIHKHSIKEKLGNLCLKYTVPMTRTEGIVQGGKKMIINIAKRQQFYWYLSFL